jgi:hypothetical protein
MISNSPQVALDVLAKNNNPYFQNVSNPHSQVALDVLAKCFGDRMVGWKPKFQEMIPSYGLDLAQNPDLLAKVLKDTDKSLGLAASA